jgi:hypothetical protein
MLSPLPRRSDWASSLLIHPAVSTFPDRVVGSACASTFSRFARRSLALRPAHSRCHQFVTRITEGFSHFVASIAAPVASGWSGCRAGLAPAGKRHLFTAHTHSCRSRCLIACPKDDVKQQVTGGSTALANGCWSPSQRSRAAGSQSQGAGGRPARRSVVGFLASRQTSLV